MTMQALLPTEARTRVQTAESGAKIVHPKEYTDADRKECEISPFL